MVTQRRLVDQHPHFRYAIVFACRIAATIAWFNHAPHILYCRRAHAAGQGDSGAHLFERLVERIEIRQEIEPLVNVPISVVIAGLLTLLAYVVAESFHRPDDQMGPAASGHNTLAVAISLFLIGFFMIMNRRKALTQVLALLSLENGIFLAAISLTYGMPMIVELGIFFDVLVAAMVLAILVYRIRETFDSMDVSRLRRLRG